MATRVDLPKETITGALTKEIASRKRQKTSTTNPLMIKIIDDEIAAFQNAINTITEIK